MAERDDLIQKLTAQREELIAQVKALSEEAAGTSPAPGEWSAKQQLAHVTHLERIFTDACRRVAVEDRPDLAAEWSGGHGDYEEANARSIAALLDDLVAARRDLLATLREVGDEQFSRTGRNTPFGDMTLLQLGKAIYRHDRMHVDQIAGREPSFLPRRTE